MFRLSKLFSSIENYMCSVFRKSVLSSYIHVSCAYRYGGVRKVQIVQNKTIKHICSKRKLSNHKVQLQPFREMDKNLFKGKCRLRIQHMANRPYSRKTLKSVLTQNFGVCNPRYFSNEIPGVITPDFYFSLHLNTPPTL